MTDPSAPGLGYMLAPDGAVWRTDGTPGGTTLLADRPRRPDIANISRTVVSGRIVLLDRVYMDSMTERYRGTELRGLPVADPAADRREKLLLEGIHAV